MSKDLVSVPPPTLQVLFSKIPAGGASWTIAESQILSAGLKPREDFGILLSQYLALPSPSLDVVISTPAVQSGDLSFSFTATGSIFTSTPAVKATINAKAALQPLSNQLLTIVFSLTQDT